MLQKSLRQYIHVLCFSNMGSFRAVDKHYISSNDLYTCFYLDLTTYKKIMSFFVQNSLSLLIIAINRQYHCRLLNGSDCLLCGSEVFVRNRYLLYEVFLEAICFFFCEKGNFVKELPMEIYIISTSLPSRTVSNQAPHAQFQNVSFH